MLASTLDQVNDSQDTVASANGDAKLRYTLAVLEELLAQSIYLRDLYRSARWQTAAIQYHHLHQLFDRHYKEQVHLVDVVIDRIRTLGGRPLFARDALQETRFAGALRGHKAAAHLLNQLLDAHESVLNTGRPNGSAMNSQGVHDFALGQVVLTNDAQSSSIRGELMGCQSSPIFLGRGRGMALDCE